MDTFERSINELVKNLKKEGKKFSEEGWIVDENFIRGKIEGLKQALKVYKMINK